MSDVDDAARAVVAAGATVIDPPAEQPWGERQAVLTDPDGHVICLVSPAG
ncbi:glyoxalase/bleomycin resistance/extradiol dioxygenase family protein [Actinoplanes sp. N902-109]|nr:VOC family protein [Actinoplanes sp. N902-109]